MKKIVLILAAFISLGAIVSCSEYETYADQKDKEREAINSFILERGITVIDEDIFNARGHKTTGNEYVYLSHSGVYMQIVREGCGKPILDKETTSLLVRFKEQSIFDTTTVITNYFDSYDPDVMTVTRTGTNYTATFTYGIMLACYGSSVPAGWLAPLNYIKVDPADETGNISKVRLIVPHTQGHTIATSNVYPYYYEITFQRPAGS